MKLIKLIYEFLEIKKPITYTEDEVRKIIIKRNREFSTSRKPFSKLLLKQDLDWFEKNKKLKNKTHN
jgi:hypothetical protein